jgi:fibronectin type 3 domain-containing protein
MILKKKYANKKLLVITFLTLIISTNTNFFNDAYNIIFRNYDERMQRTYGNCEGISYGFIKKVKENYLGSRKNILTINNDILPTSVGLFSELSKDVDKENIILLNFINTNNQKLINMDININEYELIYQEDMCFYYRKYD